MPAPITSSVISRRSATARFVHSAAKAKWIGPVETNDADTAIKDAAKEFNIQDTKKLLAVQRR
jgi:hypothetical protein